jgi:metallophosphoesterase superfamily enzyme
MIDKGLSHREISKKTGLPLSTISIIRNAPQPGDAWRVLVIGDLHEPSCRKGYFEFVQEVYKKYRCNRVVYIGDLVDWHSISFHAAHPELPGPDDEYKLAYQRIQKWYKAFPDADVIIGNHDARIVRLAENANIPAKFLRNYSEIWKTPKWNWVDHVTIDDVYYMHGISYGGLHPAFNAARHLGMSCVMGHIHSVAGVKWCVSPNKRWFGLDVGCGIDDKSMAFAYGKHMKRRSVISCGVVVDGQAHVELMPLEKHK